MTMNEQAWYVVDDDGPVAGPFDSDDEAYDYRAYIREYSDMDGLRVTELTAG